MLPLMGLHVPFQLGRSGEDLPATVTLVDFFASLTYLGMSIQVTFLRKGFPTSVCTPTYTANDATSQLSDGGTSSTLVRKN
jgi:hypothetical protein